MTRFADNIGNNFSNKVAMARRCANDDKLWLVDNNQAVIRLTWHAASSAARSMLLLRHLLQWMPLCYRSAWVCQHVTPVPQLGARRRAAQRDAANWIRWTDTIVVNHRNHQRHFLQPFNGPLTLQLFNSKNRKSTVKLSPAALPRGVFCPSWSWLCLGSPLPKSASVSNYLPWLILIIFVSVSAWSWS